MDSEFSYQSIGVRVFLTELPASGVSGFSAKSL